MGDGTYAVRALTPIEDFNEHFDTAFSDDEFDTVGGLIMQRFGHLPGRNEHTDLGEWRFTVLNADNRRIRLLQARPVPADRASLPWATDSRRTPEIWEVEVADCAADDAHIIGNMAPLYVHDTIRDPWNANELLPNRYGVLAFEDTTDLMGSLPFAYGSWWKRPGVLFPLLIRVDGRPAGFCLVESPAHDPDGRDYYLKTFFLFRTYRPLDVGQRVMSQLFDRFGGQWQIEHADDNHLRESCRAALSDRGVPLAWENYTELSFRSGE